MGERNWLIKIVKVFVVVFNVVVVGVLTTSNVASTTAAVAIS